MRIKTKGNWPKKFLCYRYTYPNKKNLDCLGSIFQFLWHFSSITARVIALSLFASVYRQWIGAVCLIHWVFMSAWVIQQRTQACNTKCEEVFFAFVLGAIYIFRYILNLNSNFISFSILS